MKITRIAIAAGAFGIQNREKKWVIKKKKEKKKEKYRDLQYQKQC